MPSVVWCARTPYFTRFGKSEVVDLIDTVQGTTHPKGWLFLDIADKYGDFHGEQVALNADHISAVGNWTPSFRPFEDAQPAQTCCPDPSSGCTNCR